MYALYRKLITKYLNLLSIIISLLIIIITYYLSLF